MRVRMRGLARVAPLVLTALVLEAAAQESLSGSAVLRRAADDYWKFLETESLAIRVREGLPIDRMPDVSLAHSEANAAFGESLLARLSRVREAGLSHEETLTLAILRKEGKDLTEDLGPGLYFTL